MNDLYGPIADVAWKVLNEPPTGADPVVEFASPDQLVAAFDDVVSLAIADVAIGVGGESLAEAAELIAKYSVRTSHPRFMNQNFAGPDPIAVAGDWLGAALNTTAATFEAAPVFTLIEREVLDKLARIAGYPTDHPVAPGIFCPGGSTATLYALQLARHRAIPDLVTKGTQGVPLTLFVSEAGHYAASKSAALLGLGLDAVIKVRTDRTGAIDTGALAQAVDDSRASGHRPFAVVATAGTTVTSAFDALHAVASVCDANNLWMHVDGCYGGSALFSLKERHRLDGLERSDSFVWNLHKMMGMTQQCTALLLSDPTQLDATFSTNADYIFQPDKLHGDLDTGDRTFQCARRVDALKLWLAYKAHGDAGFEARVDHAVAMADYARSSIDASEELAMVVAGNFTNVCFTFAPAELRPFDFDTVGQGDLDRLHALAPMIKARMQRYGTAMLGFQPVYGLNVFRLLVMNPAVSKADIDAVLGLVVDYGRECWAELSQS